MEVGTDPVTREGRDHRETFAVDVLLDSAAYN